MLAQHGNVHGSAAEGIALLFSIIWTALSCIGGLANIYSQGIIV